MSPFGDRMVTNGVTGVTGSGPARSIGGMDGLRRTALQRVRLTARVLLAAVTLVVVSIVFWPTAPELGGQRRLADWLFRLHREGLPTWINFGLVEFSANVVMFLPLGLLGALALRRHRWLILPACAAFSGAIETVQFVALPARNGTLNDVLANTSGAALGFLLAVLIWRAISRNDGPGPAGRSPSDPVLTRGSDGQA